jgi:hypothetical protein
LQSILELPMTSPTLFALLVGIDEYHPESRVRSLRGCVNDANAMRQLLVERYGAPAANIRVLTNQQAKYRAVKDAFRRHLIGNARKWQDAGAPAPAPAFLFHFSGHGSQARDETGTEPDGLDETLVAYNSRTPGVYDLKDWELGQLIEELNNYSDNVTIILDCCHSGSGTREVRKSIALTRRCPPDLRPQARRRPVALRMLSRGVSAANWEVGGKHVLLAGCRDLEESNEYGVQDQENTHWRGAMSYFLGQVLSQAAPDRPLTYRELFEQVRAQVTGLYASQSPQCEGDIDREFLGGLRPQRDRFFTIIEQRNGLNWLDAGVVHSLTEGSQLNVYPPQTRSLSAAGQPIATIEVVEERATRSGCRVVAGQVTLPLLARAVVYRLNQGDMQRKVVLDIADSALKQAVITRLAKQSNFDKEDVSPYLRVIEDGGAEFRVALRNDRLEIQDLTSAPLVAPFAIDDLDGLAADLAHLARYRNGQNLRNLAPHATLTGKVTLAVKKLVIDPVTGQPSGLDFPHSGEAGIIIQTGECVVFEIANSSEYPLYVALFDYAPTWEALQLYPAVAGANEPVQAGGLFQIGLTAKADEQITASLPDGFDVAQDHFKLIATIAPTNFELLRQGPLKSPHETRRASRDGRAFSALDALLNQTNRGGRTRHLGPAPSSVQDDWTTTELVVTVVRRA